MNDHNVKKPLAVLGIDIAKQSFQLHGVDCNGVTVLKKTLNRKKLCRFMAKLPVCTIGIEACGGANHWTRVFQGFGHAVHMMAPQFVKPYVKSNKSDLGARYFNQHNNLSEPYSRHYCNQSHHSKHLSSRSRRLG